MNYWLTTHWPPFLGEEKPPRRHVYLADEKEAAGASIRKGDHVLIYESRTGRTEIRDGARYPRGRGRMGVIAVARVTGPLKRRDVPRERYTDGSVIWWRWRAKTKVVSDSGFVPLEKVLRVLEYSPAYRMRGFGDLNSGLKLLTEEQYGALERSFRRG